MRWGTRERASSIDDWLPPGLRHPARGSGGVVRPVEHWRAFGVPGDPAKQLDPLLGAASIRILGLAPRGTRVKQPSLQATQDGPQPGFVCGRVSRHANGHLASDNSLYCLRFRIIGAAVYPKVKPVRKDVIRSRGLLPLRAPSPHLRAGSGKGSGSGRGTLAQGVLAGSGKGLPSEHSQKLASRQKMPSAQGLGVWRDAQPQSKREVPGLSVAGSRPNRRMA